MQAMKPPPPAPHTDRPWHNGLKISSKALTAGGSAPERQKHRKEGLFSLDDRRYMRQPRARLAQDDVRVPNSAAVCARCISERWSSAIAKMTMVTMSRTHRNHLRRVEGNGHVISMEKTKTKTTPKIENHHGTGTTRSSFSPISFVE